MLCDEVENVSVRHSLVELPRDGVLGLKPALKNLDAHPVDALDATTQENDCAQKGKDGAGYGP
jgi:hypothetical protein